jgi:hypothetical protein
MAHLAPFSDPYPRISLVLPFPVHHIAPCIMVTDAAGFVLPCMSTAHLGPTSPHFPRVPRILSRGVFLMRYSGDERCRNLQASLKEEIEKSLAQSA